MYIPRDIIVFMLGFLSCIILAGGFTIIVDKEKNNIDIDEDIRKFKNVIKSKFKKKKPEAKNPRQTKKEIKKKLRKMFRD